MALSLAGTAFAEEPVTITYATFSASGAQEETLKKMVEVFEEKNPDIKVDVQLTGYDDYFTKLATTVGGGNAPDVFEMNMENFLAYMLRGACADLTGLVDPASYSEGTLSAVSSDGKLYAVPMSFSTCVLFYNKALFDLAGLEYPDDTWTWTEAQAAAEKIRALGDDIWGYYRRWATTSGAITSPFPITSSTSPSRATAGACSMRTTRPSPSTPPKTWPCWRPCSPACAARTA